MPKREDERQKAITRFIVIPIIFLIGIYVAGVFIQELFGASDAAKKLFWAVGGIAFVAYYFRKQIRGFIGK